MVLSDPGFGLSQDLYYGSSPNLQLVASSPVLYMKPLWYQGLLLFPHLSFPGSPWPFIHSYCCSFIIPVLYMGVTQKRFVSHFIAIIVWSWKFWVFLNSLFIEEMGLGLMVRNSSNFTCSLCSFLRFAYLWSFCPFPGREPKKSINGPHAPNSPTPGRFAFSFLPKALSALPNCGCVFYHPGLWGPVTSYL